MIPNNPKFPTANSYYFSGLPARYRRGEIQQYFRSATPWAWGRADPGQWPASSRATSGSSSGSCTRPEPSRRTGLCPEIETQKNKHFISLQTNILIVFKQIKIIANKILKNIAMLDLSIIKCQVFAITRLIKKSTYLAT